MEAFACVAAAASLGKNCLSTLTALHRLYEKYRNARTVIAALLSEITLIGVSIQYVNVIFEQHPEWVKTRFHHNPALEQTFGAALASCNLVLSCLDEEVEKIVAGMGPDDSKGRKGKAQLIWRDDNIQNLLHTLHGQHSAIFSIIQCLQVQNITDLGSKIEELRILVLGNHQGLEHTVERSPSVCGLQTHSPSPLNVVPSNEYRRLPSSTASAPEDTASTTSSSEKVASSYRHYHATLSNISSQYSSRGRSHIKQMRSWNDDGLADEAASVQGLAPSTIRAFDPSREEDLSSDSHSTISAISTSSLTRKWLETLLSPEETTRTLRRIESTLSSSQTSARETENSIVASDTQTFLNYIRYFMPVLADLDTDEVAIENDLQTIERGEPGSGVDFTLQHQPSLELDAVAADQIPAQTADIFTKPGDSLCPSPEPTQESAYKENGNLRSSKPRYPSSGSGSSWSTSLKKSCNGYSEKRRQIAQNGVEADDQEKRGAEESKRNISGSAEPNGKTITTTQPGMPRFLIYSEKRPYPCGTVIYTGAGDNAHRVSDSFSQALTPELQHGSGTDASLRPTNMTSGNSDTSQQNPLLLHRARMYSVQKERTSGQKVLSQGNQDLSSDSESDTSNLTSGGGVQVQHMEHSPLGLVSTTGGQSSRSRKKTSKRRSTIESSFYDSGFDETATVSSAITDQSIQS